MTTAELNDWLDLYGPAVQLALQDFMTRGEWPELEVFRRRLVQMGLDNFDLESMLATMPRSSWESQTWPSDRVRLRFQALLRVSDAEPLLNACVVVVRRTYALYKSQTIRPTITSDDQELIEAVGGDAALLSRAVSLLRGHYPSPLGSGSPGDGYWQWELNLAAVRYFKDVATIDDYLAAQERLISDGRERLKLQFPTFGALNQGSDEPDNAGGPATIEVFVVMPFTEAWSIGVYDFIVRSTAGLGAPEGSLHLYRADDIADPGTITEQIENAIASADVVIADITSLNPNVMWELGYADGCRRALVILNQEHRSSPFDLYARRQVIYSPTPTKDDERRLLRHLTEALRASFGDNPPSWF